MALIQQIGGPRCSSLCPTYARIWPDAKVRELYSNRRRASTVRRQRSKSLLTTTSPYEIPDPGSIMTAMSVSSSTTSRRPNHLEGPPE